MADGESEISQNYHGSHEKLRKSTVKISENSKRQTKEIVKGIEISENYQNPCEKPKMLKIEILNSIDCTVQKLDKVDFSLISAFCPATLETTRGESIETQRAGELVWDKLKNYYQTSQRYKEMKIQFSIFSCKNKCVTHSP